MFEDGDQDARIVLFTAELLSKAGRKADAEVHLWRVFTKDPGLELYMRLRGFGGEVARERVVTFLEDRLASRQRIRWHNPADLLLRIWMHEKIYDAAWATVRKHGASMALKEELAGECEATHPREALEVYAERVDQLASTGGASAYEQAAKLVARMTRLRGKAEQVAYLLALKERFARKRNFIRLLE